MAASGKVLVVGSGVIGLRTSLELLRRKVPVVLRSPRPPLDPSVCSQGAGGLWMPFHCDDPRVDRWAFETLDELYPRAVDPRTTTAPGSSSSSPVELLPTVFFKRENSGPTTEDFVADDYKDGTGGSSEIPSWSLDPRLEFQHLTVEMLWWQNTVFGLRMPPLADLLEAGYHHAWFFRAPIVDCPRALEEMLAEIEGHPDADVDVETGVYYESLEEVASAAKSLGCTGVVNAAGLGAKDLCGDEELVGARGILHHYDRTCARAHDDDQQKHDAVVGSESPPWGSTGFPCYLIPRGPKIVVGGSYLEGDGTKSLRPSEHERLRKNAACLGIDTARAEPVGEWAGFRPYRPTSRLEVDPRFDGRGGDDESGIKIVHSYGYGGSGWTVFVGCAREAANLLLDDEDSQQ